MSDERPQFRRPWEVPEHASPEGDEIAPGGDAPARPDDTEEGEAPAGPGDPDLADWEAMAHGPSSLDDYPADRYTSATTQEYRGLAEEIRRLGEEQFERQAVSATIAGVDTGLVGFEDVTGQRGVTEEDVELAEQARSSDLALRVASALVLLAMFLGSLYLGGWWFTLFLALVTVVSLGEFYATVRKVGYAPLALIGLLGALLLPILVHRGGVLAFAGVSVAATVVIVLVFSLAPRRHPLENASITVFGMMWVGLLAFAVPIAGSEHPLAYIMMIAVTTAMIDIGSYFIGHGFGSRRLAPKLSPNKTVEGLLGGVAAGVLTMAVVSTLPPYADLGFNGSILLGLILSLAGPIGDLAESMIKRSLGVKDMGSVLPGHGGMLDRLDSFLFTVPTSYIFLLVLGLV